jgi:hypothetical protein
MRNEGEQYYMLRKKWGKKYIYPKNKYNYEATLDQCYEFAKANGGCEMWLVTEPAEYQPYMNAVKSKVANIKIRERK